MRAKTLILVICNLLLSNLLISQNITNTLGSTGTFSIKYGDTNYLTLSQSTGNISLFRNMELGGIANSTSTIGVITKNGVRFLHNYGGGNTFLGLSSGNFTMSGSNNTAVGHSSLFANTIGLGNSAFGNASLFFNTTGNFNSAIGSISLFYNTTGNNNSAFGYASLNFNTTGYDNTGIGTYSLYQNRTGWHNTAVGYDALRNNVGGFQNTAVGHHSLINNTSNYNTALGYNSGSTVTTGYNLTLIGIDANPSSPTAGDQITLGNGFVTSLRCNVTTITSLSDARDKKNIKDLTLGLDFISKLKPRLFNWDKREWYENNISDGSKMQKNPTAGFIAQELDEVQTTANAEWLNLVLKDNPEKLEATAGNLLPIMVKAIQELNEENQNLKIKNQNLEERLAKLEQIILKEQIKEVKLSGK